MLDPQLTKAPLGLSNTAQKPVFMWGKAAPATIWCSRADCSFIRIRRPAAQRPAVPTRGSAVLDGLIAATMLTMAGCFRLAPDSPAFRTALRSSSSIAPPGRASSKEERPSTRSGDEVVVP
jgi:hypothetical protein